MGLSQSTLGGGFRPQPEYSGRKFWASARVLWEGFFASARVLWEEVLGLSQSTLGGVFGPQPEYSGRGFWASARVLWERGLDDGMDRDDLPQKAPVPQGDAP